MAEHGKRFCIGAIFILFGLTAPAIEASAQTSTGGSPKADAAPNAGAAGADELGEVVVTAERRSANIQTTPIAITAISGDQLASQQLFTITDLQKNVPNMQVLDAGPYQSINIRGIGNSSITPSIVPGVAVTHDGLLADETIFIGEPFYDIADVEVLRGPQGTLVGASSTGGAVEITSQNPNFNGFNGYAEILAGNYSDQRVNAAINLPISDTLAARLAVNWEQRGSFYKNVAVDPSPAAPIGDPGSVENHNARLGLLWQPSEDFQALLKISMNYGSTDGTAGEPNQYTFRAGPGEPCPDGSAGPICHSLYYNYSTHVPFEVNMNLPSMIGKSTIDRYSLDLRWTLADGIQLRSLTGLQHNNGGDMLQDDDYSSAAGQYHTKDVGPNDNYYSQEFTVVSPKSGPINWIVGAMAFYRHTPVEDRTYDAFPAYDPAIPNPTGGLVPIGPLGTEITNLGFYSQQQTEGLFGNIDWNITDTLQLEVGARGNWDQNSSGQVSSNWFPGAPSDSGIVVQLPVPVGTPCVNSTIYSCIYVVTAGHQSDSVPTGKIDLNWTPIPGQFLYAFAARGYKSGGTVFSAPNFKPEIVNDFEAGWKSQLFNNHLQTSIGGYWMSYHEMQIPILDPVTGTDNAANVPAASTIRGIEISADGRFGGWGANLQMTIDNSKMGAVTEVANYRLPPSAANLPQCTGGAAPPLCFNYTPYEINLNGEQNPYTPKFTLNATLNYRFVTGADSTLLPSINYQYTGPQFDSIFQSDDFYLLTARHLLNTSLTYTKGPWTAEAYCNNCANEIYVAGSGGVSVGDVWYYGAPRQFGLRINRTF
jgi:iron complex outermembrane receptor protein